MIDQVHSGHEAIRQFETHLASARNHLRSKRDDEALADVILALEQLPHWFRVLEERGQEQKPGLPSAI
jgi:hypothetical protein